jgi:hypothetical protein
MTFLAKELEWEVLAEALNPNKTILRIGLFSAVKVTIRASDIAKKRTAKVVLFFMPNF